MKICVVPSEQYGDRYACVKVEVSQEKPVRYELGMTGNEELDAALGDDDYFCLLYTSRNGASSATIPTTPHGEKAKRHSLPLMAVTKA